MNPVSDVVLLLAQSIPSETALTFRYITAPPRVQGRVAGAERSEDLIRRAREVRLDEGTPFWHALFLLGEEEAGGVPIEIVRSALFHQDPRYDSARTFLAGSDFVGALGEWASGAVGRNAIALDSRARTSDGGAHYIPMLDFSVKSSRPGGEATARACVEALGMSGFLVSSGRSYHFYGDTLVDAEGQLDFWSKALLLTPMVDERWIAHQIRAGHAALRVTPNEKGEVPRVVWDVSRSPNHNHPAIPS